VLAIQRRAPDVVSEPAGTADLRISLSVIEEAGEARGTLKIDSASGSSTRVVPGADCAEVLRAVELIVALALDPNADLSSDPEPAAPSEPPEPPVPTSRPTAEARPPAPPAPPPPRASDPSRRSPATELSLGAAAFAASAIAPEVVVGGGALANLALRTPGPWSPSARLTLLASLPADTTSTAGDARFTWLAARLDACPLRGALSTALSVRPCP
jgi:hypothetical protein